MASTNHHQKSVLIPGVGCESFVDSVFELMSDHGIEPERARSREEFFANGELRIQILHPDNTTTGKSLLRDKHIYLIGTGAGTDSRKFSINDVIMHTFGILDACQRSGAKSITLLWLLFPYTRSDKKTISREPIMASMLMGMLDNFDRLKRIVTIDIHSGQLQGFTSRKAFDNLYANKYLSRGILRLINEKYSKDSIAIISPDTGSIRRTRDYLKDLAELNPINFMISKTRSYVENNVVEQSIISVHDSEILWGYTALIIDDMIDTAGTICSTAKLLEGVNVKRIIVVATHGILSDPAIERLNNCDLITDVIVTDTIDQTVNLKRCSKLRVVSVAPLIAHSLSLIFKGMSLSTLY